jgi:Antitoxin VbhA
MMGGPQLLIDAAGTAWTARTVSAHQRRHQSPVGPAPRSVPADVVTAGRIEFMGELRDKYPQHFGILDEARAQALEFAIANNVLEGWEPNEDDIRDLCEATAGHLSEDEVLRRGMDRLQRNRAEARPS